MATFRTEESYAKYEAYKAAGGLDGPCGLCVRPSLKDFTHWRIIENIFPYDNIAKVHHMIIPREHLAEAGLTEEHFREYRKIKNSYINEGYHFIIEATHKNKSIPGHMHWHLIVTKP